MSNNPKKKLKVEGREAPLPLADSLIVQFKSAQGDLLDPPVDLPQTTTVEQLEKLLNSLLKNEETVREREGKRCPSLRAYIAASG
jgi:hypothetical protein